MKSVYVDGEVFVGLGAESLDAGGELFKGGVGIKDEVGEVGS